jgi:hypothetical protein
MVDTSEIIVELTVDPQSQKPASAGRFVRLADARRYNQRARRFRFDNTLTLESCQPDGGEGSSASGSPFLIGA